MLRHTLKIVTARLLATVVSIAAMSSCSSVDDPGMPDDTTGTTLVLHVSTVDGASRAGNDSNSGLINPDVEKVKELQVIILDADGGTIEVNRTARLGTPINSGESVTLIYRLKPKSNKRIYVVGNPASCGFNFASYAEGDPIGTFETDLNACTFEDNFSEANPISLTDSRDVPADKLLPGERANVDLNLVRVATKFSVLIENKRDEEVKLLSFGISNLADKQYLMPHFTGADGKHVVSNKGAMAFDFDTNFDGTVEYPNMHWTDWMAFVVKESHDSPFDTTLADRRGWIMKYAVPTGVAHEFIPFSIGPDNPSSISIEKGQSYTLPVHYFCESRSGIINPSQWQTVANNEEQSYTFKIKLSSKETPPVGTPNEGNVDENNPGYYTKEFEQKLPNLRALFRNTHVLLKITIYQQKITCEVRVVPYVCITLDPVFGWDSLPDKPDDPNYDPDQTDKIDPWPWQ